MKTFRIFSLLLLFSVQLAAQNAWQDAVKLNEYFEFDPVRFRAEIDNSTDVDEVAIMQIVSKYCVDAVSPNEDGTFRVNLNKCFEGNPFISLRQYAQSDFSNRLPNMISAEGGNVGGMSGGGGLSGVNFVTKLADGLAIFIVKRTKEELNATFFDGLRKAMEKEPTYRAFFPATYDLLYIIGNEIYNYNAYIETLREGFINDLKVLPMNVRQYSQNNDFIKKMEYRIALEDLLGTTQMIYDGTSPLEILGFLSSSASLQDSLRWGDIAQPNTRHAMQDVANSLRSLNLLATSLATPEGDWVESSQISAQMRDISHVYLYLGLLWQEGKGIQFSNGVDFRGSLNEFANMTQAPIALRNYLVSLVQTGKLCQKSFKVLMAKSDTSFILNDEYLRFSGLLFDLLGQTRSFRQQIILPEWKVVEGKPTELVTALKKGTPTDTLENRVYTILKQLFDLEFNIRQENYTMAVANLTRFLEEVLNNEDFKYKKKFLKHVNFMANVAEARDSREIAAAIDLFALPPGSSRMKKQSAVSVSLNSYGGLAYGWEHDMDEMVDVAIEDKNVLSPSAPVGIDLNFGLGEGGSLSFYTQVIDVGAIFAYRFSNETEQIPELKFQNIIAPGFYGIYGFPNNIPISIGIGAQLGPNLRKIDVEIPGGADIKTTNAWRFGFMLAVDIPITHFYTK
ncbi:MAG: hypothetical protein K9J37_03270 [Saprospiraceae bacterium]|nr:hypothetical protein [Saprospiraceae bacterium]MCF8248903.1 hypothetical protein [Saprospiraceae bacterium]MCF8279628.1 hypothetical protein [Bacteroidales bacterium]MCF8310188.1 hypothetical protein [Saprospiraceae bacterium]MCF8439088.1 hypothetical protein [Saprospiraceae bacterium]